MNSLERPYSAKIGQTGKFLIRENKFISSWLIYGHNPGPDDLSSHWIPDMTVLAQFELKALTEFDLKVPV